MFAAIGVVLLVVAGALLAQSLSALASDWAYEMTGIRDVQGRGYDGSGIVIAIIDTGIDTTHPALDEVNVLAWRDYVNDRPEPYDDQGHGSHIAGIVAGHGTSLSGRLQGLDMKGAAPGAGLIVVKAISKEGSGSSGDVADGIRFATNSGADVICLSLGSRKNPLPIVSDDVTQAVNGATSRGILVVAAAGNTGEQSDRTDVESPADIERVIAVGAVDRDKDLPAFTAKGSESANYGSGGLLGSGARDPPDQKPEIVAPGVGIQSAWIDGQYVRADGTSQAAPFVCGALALLLEAQPGLRAQNSGAMVDRVKTELMESAAAIPGQRTPHDPRAGYGLLRADALLGQF